MSAKARGDREEQELKLLGAHQVIMELCVKAPLQRAERRAAERKAERENGGKFRESESEKKEKNSS